MQRKTLGKIFRKNLYAQQQFGLYFRSSSAEDGIPRVTQGRSVRSLQRYLIITLFVESHRSLLRGLKKAKAEATFFTLWHLADTSGCEGVLTILASMKKSLLIKA